MVLSFLKKKDIWTEVGDVKGYVAAVKQLGLDYRELDSESNGYTKSDSIWGRLAELTQISKKNTYQNRKWLCTTWRENRRKIRTTFLSTQVDDLLPQNFDQLSNIDETENRLHVEAIPHNASLLTIPSVEPKLIRSKDNSTSRYVHYFTMNYEQWRTFYARKTCDVYSGWGNQLIPHLTQLKIYCTIIFRYHHIRKKDSRKKNSNLFSATGHCKHDMCPVTVEIEVEDAPKNKDNPCVFKVTVLGDANHDPKKEAAGRSLTGAAREAMAKQVQQIGALGVYERNLRCANEDLLQEGNFGEVPSIDVLKTAKQQYNKKYRLDEDYFKELRMFRFLTRSTDSSSKEVQGYVQTSGEWPFTIHFFTEVQLDRFAKYCKTEKYPCLYIDATGSVVRKLKDQKEVFYYAMVFHDKNSSIMPLSGALLSDHTAVSITSYFNCFRSKLAIRSKVARPAFVVIDFSSALINSVLASFNVENIHNYLRRCYNTLDRIYNTKQLRNMTFLRLCCSHAMKAFSRSLFKLNVSKETRHHLMSLFSILLNTTNLNGAFVLYAQIIYIYGDPYAEHTSEALTLLLSRSDLPEFDIKPFLEESDVQDDKPNKQDFLDETDITTDPIIHQSPFNIKACANIPALRRLMKKEKLETEPCNSLYSPKIIHLLHKWFAYIPFWSCIMTDFFERYAKDRKSISTDDWEFGHGRLSNATIETYFRTIKSSILEHTTNLRPYDFLTRTYNHMLSRFKGDQFGVAQSSHGRKKARAKLDDLNVKETWRRRGRPNTKINRRAYYFSDKVSQTTACKISKGKMHEKMVGFDDSSTSERKTHSSANPSIYFDDVQSDSSSDSISDNSFGFSVVSSNVLKKTEQNIYNSRMISPASSLISLNVLPIKSSDSSDNIFSTLLTAADNSDLMNTHNKNGERQNARQHVTKSNDSNDFVHPINNTRLPQAFSPKRSHPSSDSSSSLSRAPIPKTLRQKKVKFTPPKSINKRDLVFSRDYRTTTIGNLTLTWPPYRIEKATYAGKTFSIFHTCPVDTGLFVLYHAYKAGTNDFRNLLETDTLEAYTFLRRTFQLVESDGWTIARLYWLTEKNLLQVKTKDGQYDLKSTMDEIVFKFVKPMQTFVIKSKCTCSACPKPIRDHKSMEISLTQVKEKYVNFLPAFITASEPPCGANLGPTEPLDYPANYMIDERAPVIDVETNVTRLETRYICQAPRIVDITKFIYLAPFVIINVENDLSFMTKLPDPLKNELLNIVLYFFVITCCLISYR